MFARPDAPDRLSLGSGKLMAWDVKGRPAWEFKWKSRREYHCEQLIIVIRGLRSELHGTVEQLMGLAAYKTSTLRNAEP